MPKYTYLLIGGGIAADSAARAILEIDPLASVGLIGAEPVPPYNRPPLSKALWKGMPLERIDRGTPALGIDLHLGRTAVELDPARRIVRDEHGETYTYTKLLIATGGSPIRLPGSSPRILYYRDLADYQRLRALCQSGSHFAVIGGSFIGSEIAASLSGQGKQVSMVFLEDGIAARFLPPDLSAWLTNLFTSQGVTVLPRRRVTQVLDVGSEIVMHSEQGDEIAADGVIAGLGIRPNVGLALAAGLEVENGIRVDSQMRTSAPDIFAAGDVASFPSSVLSKRIRVEHEEHANLSGRIAGLNMAGGEASYEHLPGFYSSVFDVDYDAVGELNPDFETVVDWIEPFRRGSVYYLRDERVRGVLLWNIPSRLEAARAVIAQPGPVDPASLIGRIRPLPPPPARRVVRVAGSSGEPGANRR